MRDVEREATGGLLPVLARTGSRRTLRRATASATILDVLRDEIVALRLAPGQPLGERELTERFGVSRTPVREALIRLAEESLVEIRPQSGTSVARIPIRAVSEAVLVRQALENVTVEAAARRASTLGTGELNGLIRRQTTLAEAGDRRGFHEADEAFHEAIADLAGHPGIWKIVRGVKLQIDRCRLLTLPVPGRMAQVIAEHRVILSAIASGDRSKARSAMRRHLGILVPDVAILARRHPDYFAVE